MLVGIVLGVALLALAEVFVIAPAAIPRGDPATYDVRILLPDQFLTRRFQTTAAGTTT